MARTDHQKNELVVSGKQSVFRDGIKLIQRVLIPLESEKQWQLLFVK